MKGMVKVGMEVSASVFMLPEYTASLGRQGPTCGWKC